MVATSVLIGRMPPGQARCTQYGLGSGFTLAQAGTKRVSDSVRDLMLLAFNAFAFMGRVYG